MYCKSSSYEEVAWLESHGEEYIQLPFRVTQSSDSVRVNYDIVDLSKISVGAFFGMNFTSQPRIEVGKKLSCGGSSSAINGIGLITVDYNGTNRLHSVFNGAEVSTRTMGMIDASTVYDFRLYAYKGYSEYYAAMTLKSVAIWHNDELKFDLHPCRRVKDGVLGMYDTVSKQFFTNQGTGSFIAGPATGKYY